MNWQLQEAKNKFSRVVEEARHHGPQIITVRGKETAVVLSIEEYGRLDRHEDSLLEFFRKSPLRGVDLDITRDQDWGRDIEL
ncbi:MAG: type II toxin-antitoxin system Phd/YefM family antitoxin [Candidatus Thiosymbion ectosymbiont of Robbea hypermnestra]|nr:type II toxin-antitoxin system Phd/YefM family antitoxin [Candidatus Thiosymbion ectosymbiont of Robbea hypermnestra]